MPSGTIRHGSPRCLWRSHRWIGGFWAQQGPCDDLLGREVALAGGFHGRESRTNSESGTVDDSLVRMQHRDDVRAGEEGAELEGELFGVRAGLKLTLLFRGQRLVLEQVSPLLLILRDAIADRSGPGSEFGGGGDEEAASWEDSAFHVREEALAQGREPIAPGDGRGQRGCHHFGEEAVSGGVDGGELEVSRSR